MDFTFFFSIQEFPEGGMSKTFLSKFLLVYFFLALKIFFFLWFGFVSFVQQAELGCAQAGCCSAWFSERTSREWAIGLRGAHALAFGAPPVQQGLCPATLVVLQGQAGHVRREGSRH